MTGHTIGESHRVPGCRCTSCHQLIDGAAAIDGDFSPEPGCITVCLLCGHIMVYDGDPLTLRDPNSEEQAEIAGDERILAIQRARARLPP